LRSFTAVFDILFLVPGAGELYSGYLHERCLTTSPSIRPAAPADLSRPSGRPGTKIISQNKGFVPLISLIPLEFVQCKERYQMKMLYVKEK
jgi:hypothetical protein